MTPQQQLQAALLNAEEYFSLPDQERAACKAFLGLVQTGDAEGEDLAAAFKDALSEAANLFAEKRLTPSPQYPFPDASQQDESAVPDACDVSNEVEIQTPEDLPISTESHVPSTLEPIPSTSTPGEPEPLETPTSADGTEPHEYEFHPVAAIFPLISEPDLQALADDLKANGLREPIWLHEDRIVDGRNRYLACKRVGVEPRFRNWDGQGSLATFVLSLNLHRRHLTEQQRALVAAKAKEAFEEEGRERRLSNLRQNEESTDGLDPGHRGEGKSAVRAARALNVSKDAVEKATRILKKGDDSLVDAVQAGKVSLDAASTVATLPTEEQREVVEQDRVKAKAREIRDSRKIAPDLPSAPENQPSGPRREPQPATTPVPKDEFDDALRVVLRTIRAKGPSLARRLIEKTANKVGLEVYVPTDDHDANLTSLQDIVGHELTAVDPANAHEWLDELRELLPDVKDD